MEKNFPCQTKTSFRIHPALDVSRNIKTLIPLVLDLEKVQYSCWSILFRVVARAYNVLHHIDAEVPIPAGVDTSLWAQLDAVVLSWIYATISTDLLVEILDERSTAMDTWTRLRDLFQHNNTTKALARAHQLQWPTNNQNSLGTALYNSQRFNLFSNYVEQQPSQKRKLNINLNEEGDQSDKVDSVSSLPDDVLIYLLSLLEMKTAGRTSLLSKRWRYVWTRLMDLDFDDPETTAVAMALTYTCYPQPEMDKYVKWVNQVIIANGAPYLNTFIIHFPLNEFYAADIEKWLKFAFCKEVLNLELNLIATYSRIQFFNIFSTNPALVVNTTLESLHLNFVCINGPLLEWILSNCLNLQRLSLHRCKTSSCASSKHQKLVVSSLKLKHLEFVYCLKLLNIEALHIFAPNLTSFIFFEDEFDVEYRSVPSFVDAAFGGTYSRHVFHNLDILSGFSSQLEKLSIEWYKVHCGFLTFVNVKKLEIVNFRRDDDIISLISLIEACPLLHTFKLKLSTSQLEWPRPSSPPKDAQVSAIRAHHHLKVVEYVGFAGCASAAKIALCLTQHAPMLKKFIFDPRPPRYVWKYNVYSSEYKDEMAIARSKAELLAKRIQGGVDVVIL